MDPLSGAASVIAVVTAALQSGIAIHKAVSGIRDGPEQVSRLASTLQDLNSVLRQLTIIPVGHENGRCEDHPELHKAIDRCVKDIESFRTKLVKLTVVPTDKNMGKAWKKVKSYIRKDEFRDMWQIVLRHISSLTFQLGILQRYFSFSYFMKFATDNLVEI
jgi:hypothetical protein